MYGLQGRKAIVTGAAHGIGRGIAQRLVAEGCDVGIFDLDADAARATAESLSKPGQVVVSAAGDVSVKADVEKGIGALMEKLGPIDILVNNAGILRDKSFAKMTMDDFRLVVDVHLMGAAICCKAAWDTMRQQGYGRIVMTTSSSGLYGNFGQANYGAAKMALVGLMQTLAIEGARHGIRVNALAPTAATQMTQGVLSDESLQRLAPSLVSPGLLALVGEDAPSRAILCAGGGNFAAAHVTLTEGYHAGAGPGAGERVAANWSQVVDRRGEIVPQYGFTQAERELARAGFVSEQVVVAGR